MLHLLATKFHRPAPHPRRVARPQLTRRLNEGLAAGCQITLVSAPAGFGKTTCVADWLDGLQRPVAWLALDPGDDDPASFLAYLVAALQRVAPQIGREIENSLGAGQTPPAEVSATLLINDLLALEYDFVLALDDLHVLQDDAILTLLEKLITNLPAHLHLVLMTREDPPLPLARLRANRLLNELRAGDLRFSQREAQQFLNDGMGLQLSDEDVAALESRTEGWVVGLQLAGLSMRGRAEPASFIAALSGSHRYILGYLTEEVLGRQPEEIQYFLLQTSILERLNGDLCDAVTGRSDGGRLLERLFNANLFLTPLDDEQRWYRYHHLFVDLLRSQQSRLPKEQLAELHRRAGRWYRQAGMAGEAIAHALAAADYPEAAALLEQYAMPTLLQGYGKTVEGWMQALPSQWQERSPRTCLAFAWMHLLRGSYARIGAYLQLADAALSRLDEPPALRAEWLALRANLCNVQGQPAEGLRLSRLALQNAPAQDFYVHSLAYLGLGGACRLTGDYAGLVDAYRQAIHYGRAADNILCEMMAASALTLMAIQHGQLHLAVETGRQAIERIEHGRGPTPPIAGTVYGTLGMVYYEWNMLREARAHFLRSGQLSNLSGHNAGVVYTHVLLARLDLAEGDLPRAAHSIQQAADLLASGVPAWLKPEVIAQQVRIYLAQGEPGLAGATLAAHGLALAALQLPDEAAIQPLELLYLAALRVVLARAGGAPDPEALTVAGQLIANAQKGRRSGVALQALLLRARLYAALGEGAASQEDLRAALALGEPEGYLRIFVDEGPQLAGLLRLCLGDSPQPAYLKRLLAAFPDDPAAAGVRSELTERELEVLRLMAGGLKYEEIAGRLVITVNTVRFYVKEIYSKLGVNNRTQAVETARQRGWL